MGLLTVGKPHSWDNASKYRAYVRQHGVVQFLNTYNRVKDITNDELLWGDEVCELCASTASSIPQGVSGWFVVMSRGGALN